MKLSIYAVRRLEIVSFVGFDRFKLVNRSLFKHADIAGVVRQSAKCADLRRAVESIVPLEKWTEKLEA